MKNIKVYSTGGGFYTAEAELKNGNFATVEFPWIDCLTVYKNKEFYEENMIFSKDKEELTKKEQKIYTTLLDALKKYLEMIGYNTNI